MKTAVIVFACVLCLAGLQTAAAQGPGGTGTLRDGIWRLKYTDDEGAHDVVIRLASGTGTMEEISVDPETGLKISLTENVTTTFDHGYGILEGSHAVYTGTNTPVPNFNCDSMMYCFASGELCAYVYDDNGEAEARLVAYHPFVPRSNDGSYAAQGTDWGRYSAQVHGMNSDGLRAEFDRVVQGSLQAAVHQESTDSWMRMFRIVNNEESNRVTNAWARWSNSQPTNTVRTYSNNQSTNAVRTYSNNPGSYNTNRSSGTSANYSSDTSANYSSGDALARQEHWADRSRMRAMDLRASQQQAHETFSTLLNPDAFKNAYSH